MQKMQEKLSSWRYTVRSISRQFKKKKRLQPLTSRKFWISHCIWRARQRVRRVWQQIEDICLDPGVLRAMEGLGALLIMLIVTQNSHLHHLLTLERLQFLEVLTHIKVSFLTVFFFNPAKSAKVNGKTKHFCKSFFWTLIGGTSLIS